MDEWIKKMCIHTHTMEYHSAIKEKKKEILPFATWIDLEDVMQSKTSQTRKDKYYQ